MLADIWATILSEAELLLGIIAIVVGCILVAFIALALGELGVMAEQRKLRKRMEASLDSREDPY